jgi:hypothetical protein
VTDHWRVSSPLSRDAGHNGSGTGQRRLCGMNVVEPGWSRQIRQAVSQSVWRGVVDRPRRQMRTVGRTWGGGPSGVSYWGLGAVAGITGRGGGRLEGWPPPTRTVQRRSWRQERGTLWMQAGKGREPDTSWELWQLMRQIEVGMRFEKSTVGPSRKKRSTSPRLW